MLNAYTATPDGHCVMQVIQIIDPANMTVVANITSDQ